MNAVILPVIPAAADAPRETAPEVAEASAVICIDLDIPDGNYHGVDPLTVFRLNHERKAQLDFDFDNSWDRDAFADDWARRERS